MDFDIDRGSKWEMTYAFNKEKVKQLLNEGWEPFSVRKGDMVLSGFSIGWLFGPTIYYFKRPIQ